MIQREQLPPFLSMDSSMSIRIIMVISIVMSPGLIIILSKAHVTSWMYLLGELIKFQAG